MPEHDDHGNGKSEPGSAEERLLRGRRKSDELKIAVYDALLAGVKLLAKVMWAALNK